jgi:hypothetical protein
MWQGGKNNVLIDGAAALVHQSTIQCMVCGGVIRVLKDNQTLETDGATEAPKNDQATKKKEETKNSVLDQITKEVDKKVSTLPRSSIAKFVNLPVPFTSALGYHYGELHFKFRSSWGKPEFITQMMVIALYWNYKHPNSQIMFNDISLENGGEFKPHAEHTNGDDCDFYIFYGGTNVTDISSPKLGYDLNNRFYVQTGKGLIIDFIAMVNKLYPNKFHQIIWCDSNIKELWYKVRTSQALRVEHSNHIHIGYK